MKHRPIALALALTLLCGCASPLVPNEYTVVSEHSDTTVETESDALTAESYEELKYAILAFVETGTTQGIIRVYHYDGDVTEDITSAAYEVWKNDPMGAYAVEFITTECNLLLSYYEIRVEITYRDDVVDASQIQYVRGTSGAERAIQEALEDMKNRLTLRISAYDEELRCEEIVARLCAESPEVLIEQPKVTESVYPDSGSIRIVQLDFEYQHTVAELMSMRSAVNTVLGSAVNYVRYREEDSAKADLLFSYLMERFDYEEGESITPVYSLLCEGVADSKTFARIFQILCDRTGLECVTVSGYLDGESYEWNILNLDGVYRHVDLMRCVREDIRQLTAYTDDEMDRYSWDRAAYPTCEAIEDTSVETSEDALMEIPEDQEPESPETQEEGGVQEGEEPPEEGKNQNLPEEPEETEATPEAQPQES